MIRRIARDPQSGAIVFAQDSPERVPVEAAPNGGGPVPSDQGAGLLVDQGFRLGSISALQSGRRFQLVGSRLEAPGLHPFRFPLERCARWAFQKSPSVPWSSC